VSSGPGRSGRSYPEGVGPLRSRPNAVRRLALVGSDRTLDLARLARAAGALEARLAAPRDAERWTGLSLGGISPLAVRPASFEVLADERLRDEPRVFISAGVRGLELELAPADLARSVDAQWVRLV
jgi:Cys-tRNA(Pro)/Cys-tRNA(Cys) deacylase